MLLWHALTLLGLMVVFGALGGVVSYYSNTNTTTQSMKQSIVLGLAASLLVPLFLNMIASDLISFSGDFVPEKYFVFGGICLSAAIASKSFINKVTDQIWKKYDDIEQRLNLIENHVVEPEFPDLIDKDLSESYLSISQSSEEEKILRLFWQSPYIFRNINGLSKETNQSIEEVKELINKLKNKGFIREKKKKNGLEMFYLTDLGREHVVLISRLHRNTNIG